MLLSAYSQDWFYAHTCIIRTFICILLFFFYLSLFPVIFYTVIFRCYIFLIVEYERIKSANIFVSNQILDDIHICICLLYSTISVYSFSVQSVMLYLKCSCIFWCTCTKLSCLCSDCCSAARGQTSTIHLHSLSSDSVFVMSGYLSSLWVGVYTVGFGSSLW